MKTWPGDQCHRGHPLTPENVSVNSSDGRRRCKECQREANRRLYARKKEELLEAKRMEHNAAKAVATNTRWRAQNPEKRAAHSAVEHAVRTGKLHRPSKCERCGEECRPHAHHDDYSRQLEVRWLCAKCHRGIHTHERESQ